MQNTKTHTVLSASNPEFAFPDHSAIRLTVVFKELEHLGPIPFVAHPSDTHDHGRELYKRAMDKEFGQVRPCPVTAAAFLAEHKTLISAQIDAAAHAAHGAGSDAHSPIYSHRVDEARRVAADQSPKAEDYPLITALVGHEGNDLQTVAASIRTKDDAWRKRAAVIERTRVSGKSAINAATSVDQAQASFRALKFSA